MKALSRVSEKYTAVLVAGVFSLLVRLLGESALIKGSTSIYNNATVTSEPLSPIFLIIYGAVITAFSISLAFVMGRTGKSLLNRIGAFTLASFILFV